MTFLDRWYGTEMTSEEVAKKYQDDLASAGWAVFPEEVVEIWSKESKEGLYRIHMDIFADPKSVPPEQGSYKLPDSIMSVASKYKTVYLMGMTYMYPWVAKKCSGR